MELTPEQLELFQRLYGGGQPKQKKLEWHKLSFKGKIRYFFRKCFNTLTQPSDSALYLLFPFILSLGVFAGYKLPVIGGTGKPPTMEEILQRLLAIIPRFVY
jgi:hypothetical protein